LSGIYNNLIEELAAGGIDFESADIWCMLLRSTSTYGFNADDNFVSTILGAGAVEISVSSYARVQLTGGTNTLNETTDKVYVTFDDISFGAIGSGQSVSAAILYLNGSGDSSHKPLVYLDGKTKITAAAPMTAASTGNITAATTGNPVVITSASHGLSNGDEITIASVGGMTQINGIVATVANKTTNTFELSGVDGTGFTAYTSGGTWKIIKTLYVDPVQDTIPNGADVSFTTCTGKIHGSVSVGSRTVKVKSASAAIGLAETSEVNTTSVIPVALTGGTFTIPMPSEFLTL